MDTIGDFSKTIKECGELINGYVVANSNDWFDIDKATLTKSWSESEEIFSFILCMRKTGSDIILLNPDRKVCDVIADINQNLIQRSNEKFYIINPAFNSGIREVSALKAFTWCMYVMRDKLPPIQFEADGTVKLT